MLRSKASISDSIGCDCIDKSSLELVSVLRIVSDAEDPNVCRGGLKNTSCSAPLLECTDAGGEKYVVSL